MRMDRLFNEVYNSVINLYGQTHIAILRRPQRVAAIRVIRGFRAISFETATYYIRTLRSGYSSLRSSIGGARILWQWAELHQILVVECEYRLARPSAGYPAILAVRVAGEEIRSAHFSDDTGVFWTQLFWQVLVSIRPETHCDDCIDETARHFTQWWNVQLGLTSVVF